MKDTAMNGTVCMSDGNLNLNNMSSMLFILYVIEQLNIYKREEL
jgi:hypothetical protein